MELEYILRIVIAGICGICIGTERTHRSKEAGIRTHCIVALGAALMMVISKYGFSDIVAGENGMRGADGARIAAQVVSGIGFLGAGMIFVRKDMITGLTTAAGIWVTSGVGMAIGAGMYGLGIAASVTVIAVQSVLHMRIVHQSGTRRLKIKVKDVDRQGYEQELTGILTEHGIKVNDVSAERSNGVYSYSISAETEADLSEEEILELTEFNASVSSVRA